MPSSSTRRAMPITLLEDATAEKAMQLTGPVPASSPSPATSRPRTTTWRSASWSRSSWRGGRPSPSSPRIPLHAFVGHRLLRQARQPGQDPGDHGHPGPAAAGAAGRAQLVGTFRRTARLPDAQPGHSGVRLRDGYSQTPKTSSGFPRPTCTSTWTGASASPPSWTWPGSRG